MRVVPGFSARVWDLGCYGSWYTRVRGSDFAELSGTMRPSMLGNISMNIFFENWPGSRCSQVYGNGPISRIQGP